MHKSPSQVWPPKVINRGAKHWGEVARPGWLEHPTFCFVAARWETLNALSSVAYGSGPSENLPLSWAIGLHLRSHTMSRRLTLCYVICMSKRYCTRLNTEDVQALEKISQSHGGLKIP